MSGRPVVVIRPQPGNAVSVRAAREAGLEACGFPLFAAGALPWHCPDPDGFDGLLIASANAVRLAGPQLDRLRALPVHAVGSATAAAARAGRLQVATLGSGDLADLLSALPLPLRLLRLAGEEHVALAPRPGLTIETRVVYRITALPLSPGLVDLLRDGCLVLLHSAAAARHFVGECQRAGLDRQRIALACIAPRVAAAAGGGWREAASAATPDDAALLALAGRMCQRGSHGVSGGNSARGG